MNLNLNTIALIESLGMSVIDFLKLLFNDYDNCSDFVRMIAENESLKEDIIDALINDSTMSTRLREEFEPEIKQDYKEELEEELEEEINDKIEDRLRKELGEDEDFIIESIPAFTIQKRRRILKESGLLTDELFESYKLL